MLRDLAIVILAVFQIIAAAAIILLAWQMWRLTRLIYSKVGDASDRTGAVLDQAGEAAASAADSAKKVNGTVSFLSDTVVTPVIGVAAAVSGAAKFMEILFRTQKRN